MIRFRHFEAVIFVPQYDSYQITRVFLENILLRILIDILNAQINFFNLLIQILNAGLYLFEFFGFVIRNVQELFVVLFELFKFAFFFNQNIFLLFVHDLITVILLEISEAAQILVIIETCSHLFGGQLLVIVLLDKIVFK